MKISKTAVLTIGGMFATAGLGLMFVSADKELFIDLDNAIQHIDSIDFITTGYNDRAVAKKVGDEARLVGIKTNNFVLSQTGNRLNVIDGNKIGNTILGGEKNAISGSYDVILAGYRNISDGAKNTILGGEDNKINGGKNRSTILGGKNNEISKSNGSAIVGGSNNRVATNDGNNGYSVVVGSNSSVTGIYSTALGANSHVNADSSFLWTDGNHPEVLRANNVFAVVSNSGMVINTDTAHSLAQLTIGKPMVVYESKRSEDIKCGNNQGGGIMKVVENVGTNQVCFCSCDGSGRNSLFGKGTCKKACQGSGYVNPVCGNTVEKICDGTKYTYSGSCTIGEVVGGTGAYFVIPKDGTVYWSCQTEGGVVKTCTGHANNSVTCG